MSHLIFSTYFTPFSDNFFFPLTLSISAYTLFPQLFFAVSQQFKRIKNEHYGISDHISVSFHTFSFYDEKKIKALTQRNEQKKKSKGKTKRNILCAIVFDSAIDFKMKIENRKYRNAIR